MAGVTLIPEGPLVYLRCLCRESTLRSGRVSRHTSVMRWCSLFAVAILFGFVRVLNAQEAAPDAGLTTLHVYMDLVQVPVLVLSSSLEPMKPVDTSRFSVSLDAGPQFKPKHSRQQGEDAISLGILMDLRGPEDVLMPRMAEFVAGLAPRSLHATDRVSVFAMNCNLTRTLRYVTPGANLLQSGIDRALESWTLHRGDKPKDKPPCAKPSKLWDAMARVLADIGQQPGRRVLLVVTDGVDGGSTMAWDQVRTFAQASGVTIFGLSVAQTRMAEYARRATHPVVLADHPDDYFFNKVCQLSGGIEMKIDPDYLQPQLARFIQMLRERYILEFLRPRNATAGRHEILVRIANSDALILPAAVTVPLESAEKMAAPDTIPHDELAAPAMGRGKVPKF